MDHSINLTHDGTLIIRIPKGYQVDKVVVEEMGTDDRRKFVHMPADISDYCDELWEKAYERGKAEGQSTQKTPSNTLGALDCVDRQAAIDACTDRHGICIAKQRLLELPSAQPERTCVNCGRTVNNGGWYADGRTRCPIEEHYALPKDGFCHLWEKRNVTDDDYPERRTDE